MNTRNAPTTKKGFTLLETLVAVTILALAIAGPLYVADRVLVAAQISRDQLVASYLAQEGIEYVRSMRDHEFLYADANNISGSSCGGSVSACAWAAFTGAGGSGLGSIAFCQAVACMLDPFVVPMGYGRSLTTCISGRCTPLYLTTGGQYRQSNVGGTSTQTPFTRAIQAQVIGSYAIKITSIVTWTNRGTPYSVTSTDILTPWQ